MSSNAGRQTILQIIQKTTALFQDRGIDSPRFDAETLIGHAIGMNRMALYLNHEMPMKEAELASIRPLIARRANREPLQYITGEAPFMDIILKVRKGVLIPRPDTETLVESVMKWWNSCFASMNPLISEDEKTLPSMLDLCTGSGAIPIVLSRFLGTRSGLCFAVDISEDACEIARQNVALHAQGKMKVLNGDLFRSREAEPLPDVSWNLITANPPYIPSSELAGLMAEVGKFEPRLALDGGSDGLDFYRRLIPQSLVRLTAGGRIYLESGAGQAQQVEALLLEAGFSLSGRVRDLGGIERVIWGQK